MNVYPIKWINNEHVKIWVSYAKRQSQLMTKSSKKMNNLKSEH
jgi:hypothetical protein